MSPYVRISVVIPVYNGGIFISDMFSRLEKLLGQEDEIIFVDNNSTDNSLSEIDKIMSVSKIQVQLLEEKKQGSGPARNTGMRHAKGEYLVFIDIDDEVTSKHIHSQLEFLQKKYCI